MSGLAILVKGTMFSDNVGNIEFENKEVTEFINATGLFEFSDKLNTLVGGLKSAGIWPKITALYPMLGTSFEQMSYNLKDRRIAQLSLKGGAIVTVADNIGYTRQGTIDSGGYISCNHGFNSTQLNNYHMIVATNLNYDVADLQVPIGVGAMSDGSCIVLVHSKKIIFRNNLNNGITTVAETLPTAGGLIVASTKGLVLNGVPKSTTNLSQGNFNNTKNYPTIYLGGYRTENPKDGIPVIGLPTYQYKIAGFGSELTTSEMQTYSKLLNDFKNLY